MNELIHITENNGKQAVSARELHRFLEIETPFTMWAERMIDYGFAENVDYQYLSQKSEKPLGGRPSIDYALTLDTAKHWSMMQRNGKGMQARNYFIEVEKRATKPMTPAELLLQQCQMLVEQERRVQELESGQKQIEQKVAVIEAQTKTRSDYFTVVGYASLHKIECGLKLASSLGRKAAILCKSRGIQTEDLPDPRFGSVKTYPLNILEEVFNMALN